jgi:hypothetical protein
MVDDDTQRQWSEWVDRQIGGDSFRRRAALEAALQSLQTGHGAGEAAAAAHAAVGAQPAPPSMPYQPAVMRCRFCGSMPAVPLTIYEHNGFVIMMQFKQLTGPFCRSCGLNVWRRMTDTTLWRGWWGFLSFFIAPVTALINLANLRKLTSLPPPDPTTAVRRPGDPGVGMFGRSGIYVYAGMLLVLFIVFVLPSLVAR